MLMTEFLFPLNHWGKIINLNKLNSLDKIQHTQLRSTALDISF